MPSAIKTVQPFSNLSLYCTFATSISFLSSLFAVYCLVDCLMFRGLFCITKSCSRHLSQLTEVMNLRALVIPNKDWETLYSIARLQLATLIPLISTDLRFLEPEKLSSRCGNHIDQQHRNLFSLCSANQLEFQSELHKVDVS
jgi:hypothetical protein